ncbi:MAG: T9SS type A sorting domain-containing protein, partial [Bacteroidales bacterium]|nr:T9SS type A sorting domain-containing protein [Bacteroidales bacterium]
LTETENNISIYAFDNTVYVNYQLKAPGNVVVYDMIGKEIISENLNPGQLNKLTVNHGKGYYIVKVFSEEAVKTEKVFIN